jgi:hypothetical protein
MSVSIAGLALLLAVTLSALLRPATFARRWLHQALFALLVLVLSRTLGPSRVLRWNRTPNHVPAFCQIFRQVTDGGRDR